MRGGRGPPPGGLSRWQRCWREGSREDLDHSPDEPSEGLQEPHDPLFSAAVHITSDGHAAAHERGADVILKGVNGDRLPLGPEWARAPCEGAAEALRAAHGAARSGASLCEQEDGLGPASPVEIRGLEAGRKE